MARDTKPEVDATAEAALDAIYREHFEFVSCVLHRFGVAAADLDDATQDVFVVAHGKLADFEGRAAVRTWLYSIAMRVASNRRRKHARRDALLSRLPRAVPEDLEELAARGQARAILHTLIDRLDEHKRVVFVLAELEELTVPTIASIVGENPRTIYSRLRAARARVASDLEQLQMPVDESIVAARVRPSVPAERAQRVWAGVVAAISGGIAPAPIAAGLSLWAKLAIAGGVAASIGVVAIVVPDDPPPKPVIAKAPDEPTHAATTAAIATASPPREPQPPSTSIDAPPPRPARTQPLAQTRPQPPAPAPASDTLADEIAAIDRARDHVAHDRATEALAELDRYAARFDAGALRKDAAAVRVSALCKAGRDGDAIAIAEAAGLPTPRCR